ncbi:MAG TPA: carbohydrate ABC transporter permease [Roseiflexaceae bacterium]|nr:carbohydrate ABC transporter permease [Roseiflexaceae bacterium]
MGPSASQTAVAATLRRRQQTRRLAGGVMAHLLLILVATLFAVPFAWLIITSLKPLNQVFTDPLVWIPDPIMWSNYAEALTSPAFPFLRLLGNTLFYAVAATAGTIISGAIIAYAFARMEFRGRDLLFGITLATMMLPGIVTLIPTYLLFRWLGWVGTYAPLIVPLWFGSAFNIFLLRQFMMTIPIDLTDAAKIDGAGDFTILWRIMVPLIKPALLVVGLFQFMAAWNDFFNPLIYLDEAAEYPLVLGLYAFRTRFGVQWHLIMAASLAVTFPIIVLFFVAQRYFIEGVTLSGLKGA